MAEEEILDEQANVESSQPGKPAKGKGLASLLGKLDLVSEIGLKKVLFNMPFVLFLFSMAALHIANNHMAENYARNITKTEREVKQLRWQYMTSASGLMKKSKQSEVARIVGTQGIKELRIPPYKIEVNKD